MDNYICTSLDFATAFVDAWLGAGVAGTGTLQRPRKR
jgi:hypothetical protein